MNAPATPRLEPGPLLALAGLVAGVLLGERAGPSPAVAPFLVGVGGLAAAWFTTGRVRVAIAVLALALLGAAVMQRALHGLVDTPLVPMAHASAEVVVRGTLVADPTGTRFRTDMLLRVGGLAGHEEPGRWQSVPTRTVLVRASGEEAGRLAVLEAGDRVDVRGVLEPLAGFDLRYRWSHAVALLADTDVLAFGPPSGPFFPVANHLRGIVLRGMAGLPADDRALLAGFLLGDTRAVPRDTIDTFRASGLSHLLAVSGANVAFVLAVAGPVLRRLGLQGRLLVGLVVVTLFAAATRFEPSVLRASALAATTMLAVFLGRPSAPARLLALAISGLLLVDPFLLHSVGFVLSCAASAGIVVLAPRLTDRLVGPRWVRLPVAVTIAAQLGVAPVLLTVFGSMPLVAPVTNFLAVPVAEPLGVYGLLASTVAGVLAGPFPALAPALHVPTRVMVGWIDGVADEAAAVPFAIGGRTAVLVVAVVAAAAAIYRATLRRDAGRAVPDVASG